VPSTPRLPRCTAGGGRGKPALARAAHRRRASQPRAWRCTRTTAARRAATTADAGVYTPAQRRARTLTPMHCAQVQCPGACKRSRNAMRLTCSYRCAQHNSRSAGMLAAQQYQTARPRLYRGRPARQQSERTADTSLHKRQGVWGRRARGDCAVARRVQHNAAAGHLQSSLARRLRAVRGRAPRLRLAAGPRGARRRRRCRRRLADGVMKHRAWAQRLPLSRSGLLKSRRDCVSSKDGLLHAARVPLHKSIPSSDSAKGQARTRSRGSSQVCRLKAWQGWRKCTCAAVTEAAEEGL